MKHLEGKKRVEYLIKLDEGPKKQAAELKGEHEMEAHVNDARLLSRQVGVTTKKGIVFNSLINEPYGAVKGPTADPKAGDQHRHWLAAPAPRCFTLPDLPSCRFTCPNSLLCFILDQHFPTVPSWFA